MAQQDAGLDMLHDIVVRQKGMGQQIFREVSPIEAKKTGKKVLPIKWQVTTQNELIDDIGDRTENVNARLLATTGYVSSHYTVWYIMTKYGVLRLSISFGQGHKSGGEKGCNVPLLGGHHPLGSRHPHCPLYMKFDTLYCDLNW